MITSPIAVRLSVVDASPASDMGTSTLIHRFGDVAALRSDHPAVLGDTGTLTTPSSPGRPGGTRPCWRRRRPTRRPGRPADRARRRHRRRLLGALAAGRAYVPLDPGFPVERLRHMLDAAGGTAVLCAAEHARPGPRLAADGRAAVPLARRAARAAAARAGGPGRPRVRALHLRVHRAAQGASVQSHRNLIARGGPTRSPRSRTAARPTGSACSPRSASTRPSPTCSRRCSPAPPRSRSTSAGTGSATLAERAAPGTASPSTTPRPTLSTGTCWRPRRCGGWTRIRVVLLGGEEADHAGRGTAAGAASPPAAVLVNGYGATEITFAARYATAAGRRSTRRPPARCRSARALPGLRAGRLGRRATGEIVVRRRHRRAAATSTGRSERGSATTSPAVPRVPHRRPGPHGSRRPAALPRPDGPAGQGARLPGRAERDRGRARPRRPGVAGGAGIAAGGSPSCWRTSGRPGRRWTRRRCGPAVPRGCRDYMVPRAVVPLAGCR